ncbi:transcriptional regulator MntR [Candidatus Formimonas warabiya]|uniref:Manganese transport regulator n=1 Tax=Formimonas warabiya TaxID=1761012 RepID=A0A3G1KVF1_FORW1|nr:transcriptional regulator MntR [Candidatus Formimonas warabiya]ATW26422.1 Fur family transcriptional regulator [Candidatus Formimonas warabiya]
MNDSNNEFYTFRGYAKQHQGLTPSMEDYLEMIFRLSQNKFYTRINDLASALNVQPPSATKMVQKLAELNYLKYEKYGIIELTPVGIEVGRLLLKRHEKLETFLRLLGVQENVLEDTEKIEHSLSEETLECICHFVEFMQATPAYVDAFQKFPRKKDKE